MQVEGASNSNKMKLYMEFAMIKRSNRNFYSFFSFVVKIWSFLFPFHKFFKEWLDYSFPLSFSLGFVHIDTDTNSPWKYDKNKKSEINSTIIFFFSKTKQEQDTHKEHEVWREKKKKRISFKFFFNNNNGTKKQTNRTLSIENELNIERQES